jgi:NAD(P)H-hydrate epimerase
MRAFDLKDLKKLYKPKSNSSKEDNGQITIIGGSSLFHGAPILALKTASRIVDMVFFSSPEKSLREVASIIKAQLSSFIWVPWEEVEEYIKKSDAILIGPGFMRYRNEKQRKECLEDEKCGIEAEKTKKITKNLIKKFPQKKWVIDAGSLQTIEAKDIPQNAIITPNKREFKLVFKDESKGIDTMPGKEKAELLKSLSQKYKIYIVLKGAETIVSSPNEVIVVKGGNAGLTKGGTGDILAGLATALLAKNDPLLAASVASFIVKKAADELYKKVGFNYNADDLSDFIPETLKKWTREK